MSDVVGTVKCTVLDDDLNRYDRELKRVKRVEATPRYKYTFRVAKKDSDPWYAGDWADIVLTSTELEGSKLWHEANDPSAELYGTVSLGCDVATVGHTYVKFEAYVYDDEVDTELRSIISSTDLNFIKKNAVDEVKKKFGQPYGGP